MDRTIISRIEAWDSRSVSGGYVGLNALADDGFTGAVSAGGTHLFMLNGRVVGVFDGDISAFEGADAEAYTAPDPALPLLFSMQEQGGEVRGKYYTGDTPIGSSRGRDSTPLEDRPEDPQRSDGEGRGAGGGQRRRLTEEN